MQIADPASGFSPEVDHFPSTFPSSLLNGLLDFSFGDPIQDIRLNKHTLLRELVRVIDLIDRWYRFGLTTVKGN